MIHHLDRLIHSINNLLITYHKDNNTVHQLHQLNTRVTHSVGVLYNVQKLFSLMEDGR
jgi:hypothetical protein